MSYYKKINIPGNREEDDTIGFKSFNGEIGRQALDQITIPDSLRDKFDFFVNDETGDLCVVPKEKGEEIPKIP